MTLLLNDRRPQPTADRGVLQCLSLLAAEGGGKGGKDSRLTATSARAFLPKGELSLRTFDEAISA
ncbi:hypothetical protein ACOCJ7_16980 [Knoellia sp. CPCC 206453]|uniref:hypothetical protein n=1 Tax=Knoellia pratensis TaxID=3404796 RepID=UPI0036235559